jgi:hypothetical protein
VHHSLIYMTTCWRCSLSAGSGGGEMRTVRRSWTRTTLAGLALIRTARWIGSVIVATLICRLRISDEIREHPIPAGDVTPAVRDGDPMCCLGLTIRLEGTQFVVESIRHPSLLHNDECQVVAANTGRSKGVPWFNQAC